ncbi:MAG TPA: GNAT family protein [Dehalococcoidia bacterium]|nr:GNAT family protein [Dehalococcoidia bacterium]
MLTGKLVELRAVEAGDLDRYHVWINDREVIEYIAALGLPVSRAQEEEWLQHAMRQTAPPEITLAIDTIDEGRHIGSVALHEVSLLSGKAILGIMIGDKSCWSRGYGTDAIVTLLRFAFDDMNLHRVALEVHEENARAIACYRKCGFVEEGRLRHDRFRRGEYRDTLIMGVLADEFRVLHHS